MVNIIISWGRTDISLYYQSGPDWRFQPSFYHCQMQYGIWLYQKNGQICL